MEKEGREVEGECMGMKGRGREKLMEGWQIMKELTFSETRQFFTNNFSHSYTP